MQVKQFKQLTNAVMEGVGAGRSDTKSLAQAAQLLQKNPDVYTVWNHRRKALQGVLEVPPPLPPGPLFQFQFLPCNGKAPPAVSFLDTD